ncbi:MAG: hypothetical protein VX745_02480 [Pseudomonadota bacterium]|nr:hypothetical protein [Pseudomonadota bacterium]
MKSTKRELWLLHDKPIQNDLTQNPALMIVATRAETGIRQRRDLVFNAQLEAQIREKQ